MNQDELQRLFQQAANLHRAGRLAEAEPLYSQVIEALPHGAEPRNMLGVLRLQQGRREEGLELIHAAVRINPRNPDILGNYAQALTELGRFDEALVAIDQVLAVKPDFPDAGNIRAQLLQQLGRFPNSDRTLRPDVFEALYNRSVLDRNMNRDFEALVGVEKALALRPDSAECWNIRGSALRSLKRTSEALASFDRALAISPRYPAALCNRGSLLMDDLGRVEDALAAFEQALALQPDFAECWNNRGHALRELGRLDAAMASYTKALEQKPDLADAMIGRGHILFEMNRTQEGITAFREAAAKIQDSGNDEAPSPAHKQRHDQEQLAWRQGAGASGAGQRVAGAAIRPGNQGTDISAQWPGLKPQIAVIDNLLTDEALAALRRFCLEEPVWRQAYPNGYLGAFPEHGFACPLLGQIADELRQAYPAIFQDHALNYLWGFKYDSQLTGIGIHADQAAVNVNFWITPDDANLDPESGGLVVWDMAAPLDWNFDKFNHDKGAIRDFLASHDAKPRRVPHRQNRAVIFDSDLFHETDAIRFKDSYENRRINVTMLYGRRNLAIRKPLK
jgi:tetratricopeptide (TPR) repeat protein